MRNRIPVFSFFLMLSSQVFAQERVWGANATLSEVASPRIAAMGGAGLGVSGDALSASGAPAHLLDVQSYWLAFTHSTHFAGARYDHLAGSLPVDSTTALGISLARYGIDDIPWIKEGEVLPEGSDFATLSIADYVFGTTLARAFGFWEAGISVFILYRKLDQSGWGFRGDAALRYRQKHWFVGAHLEGFTGSQVRWQSGWKEFSPAEMRLGGGWKHSFPYFYGTLHLGMQSAGMFHQGGRLLDWRRGDLTDTSANAIVDIGGKRPFESPLQWMQESSAGLEFRFDWGASIRAGLQTINQLGSYTLGGGLQPVPWMSVDYGLVNHPVLGKKHRVALSLSPGILFTPDKAKLKVPEQTRQLEKADEKVVAPEEKKEETPISPDELKTPAGIHWEE